MRAGLLLRNSARGKQNSVAPRPLRVPGPSLLSNSYDFRRYFCDMIRGMSAALEQARRAASLDEVPIGAVVMRGDEIVAAAHNETIARKNPTYHAEFLAIERALEALETDRLTDCTLYVTIEPCALCAGAIVLAKVGKLVFGAYDEKAGMCGSLGDLVRHPRLNHRVEVTGGVEAETSADLIKTFFAAKRSTSQPHR